MTDITEQIRLMLLSEKDEKYRLFNLRLIPNISPDTIIGVRIPIIRRIAKDAFKEACISDFLNGLPHKYHEENLLHAIIIGMIRDTDECLDRLESFLPYVDNWTVCDSLRPKVFKNHTPTLEAWLFKKAEDPHPYTARFAIEMMMLHYMDEEFKIEQMEKLTSIVSDDYYLNMMVAWYFATALAKQYDHAVKFLEEGRLPLWIHNKTISKACDSYRLSGKQKTYLKTLRMY